MTVLTIMILVWTFCIFGFTQILVESSIFEPVREYFAMNSTLEKLINCFLCVSVWVSGIMSLLLFSPCGFLWPELHKVSKTVLDAMLGSSLAWLIHCVEIYLVRKK